MESLSVLPVRSDMLFQASLLPVCSQCVALSLLPSFCLGCIASGKLLLFKPMCFQGLPSYQPGLDRGDLFVFDYGVVVCWGLSAAQELSVLSTLRPCQVKPLRPEDIHKEELGFQYTSDQLPNIQNDVITISR
ncbi:hypothetical protein DUNSADRAFT_8017 [Dunaliella salina]|uniref:DUF155 domain-containing protein n=1 Tax=Dunaliella salina TaxID=3046 RepID=A0ABQ7GK97_DUNSA|nr:hypothetical protein DUNSADRAFT_8017 [Dunaliella salina]|eukprot:KAF5835014.1 hypothetical protein DUNSADRAFT_8017 [Dunaliella salina]